MINMSVCVCVFLGSDLTLTLQDFSCQVWRVCMWVCLTCLSEAMVLLLVLLDSLCRAVFLGDRGLGATFGGENTSPWSSIISTLASPPPSSPFLPLLPLTACAAPSSSNSFWRLIASTCLILLFSSRTRSISMKSSCTCSSLEEKAQIHLYVCVDFMWCVMDRFFYSWGLKGFVSTTDQVSVWKPLWSLWRWLLLQGPNSWCFHAQFLCIF